jgi:glycosyltransferase involved in cell wall biosynthesis
VKITFDAWNLDSASRGGGIARDTTRILVALQNLGPLELVNSHESKRGNLRRKCCKLVVSLKTIFGIKTDVAIVSDLFWANQPNGTVNSKAKLSVVRIHDVFPLTNPEWFKFSRVLRFRQALKIAIRSESVFVCNSNATASNFRSLGLVEGSRIFVLPCEVTDLNSQKCESCSGCTYATSTLGNYLISVGTLEPRKNYEFQIMLLSMRSLENQTLIIVGREGWKSQEIKQKLGEAKNVIWLEQVCDGALKILYRNASCFISTSHDEGFNIPASEAHYYDLPLILSDIEVHRERHPLANLVQLDSASDWEKEIIHQSMQNSDFNRPASVNFPNDWEAIFEKLVEDFPL